MRGNSTRKKYEVSGNAGLLSLDSSSWIEKLDSKTMRVVARDVVDVYTNNLVKGTL